MYINDLEHILVNNLCDIDFSRYKMALMLYADVIRLDFRATEGIMCYAKLFKSMKVDD